MKKVVFAIVLLASGCASEIMEGYVGQDITEVMIDYGPPSAVLDLPDGRVAFQWEQDYSYTSPTTTNVVGSSYGYGSGYGYGYGNYSATATTYGGDTTTWSCLYTFFAKPNPQGSHTVIGFKKPDLFCE